MMSEFAPDPNLEMTEGNQGSRPTERPQMMSVPGGVPTPDAEMMDTTYRVQAQAHAQPQVRGKSLGKVTPEQYAEAASAPRLQQAPRGQPASSAPGPSVPTQMMSLPGHGSAPAATVMDTKRAATADVTGSKTHGKTVARSSSPPQTDWMSRMSGGRSPGEGETQMMTAVGQDPEARPQPQAASGEVAGMETRGKTVARLGSDPQMDWMSRMSGGRSPLPDDAQMMSGFGKDPEAQMQPQGQQASQTSPGSGAGMPVQMMSVPAGSSGADAQLMDTARQPPRQSTRTGQADASAQMMSVPAGGSAGDAQVMDTARQQPRQSPAHSAPAGSDVPAEMMSVPAGGSAGDAQVMDTARQQPRQSPAPSAPAASDIPAQMMSVPAGGSDAGAQVMDTTRMSPGQAAQVLPEHPGQPGEAERAGGGEPAQMMSTIPADRDAPDAQVMDTAYRSQAVADAPAQEYARVRVQISPSAVGEAACHPESRATFMSELRDVSGASDTLVMDSTLATPQSYEPPAQRRSSVDGTRMMSAIARESLDADLMEAPEDDS